MPFVVDQVRDEIAEKGYQVAAQVGDLCYIFYHEMLVRFIAKPRWTMAHMLKKEYVINPKMSEHIREVGDELIKDGKLYGQNPIYDYNDIFTAAALAYDVFFNFYVIPYERQKQEENGDILPQKSLRKRP